MEQRDVLIMSPWTEVIPALAMALTSLSTSGCTSPHAVRAGRPERAALHTVEATPSAEPMATPLPTPRATSSSAHTRPPPTATSSLTPTRPPLAATQTPALTATASPSPTVPSLVPSPEPTPAEVSTGVTLTILYDNNAVDERLRTGWGFSCLVERGDLTLLFDTGGDAPTLLSNVETLGLDPTTIDMVVLSHIHGDHVGGLAGILESNEETSVYLPRSFPASFREQAKARAHSVEVHEPMELAEGIYTTGEIGREVIEQSLVLVTDPGLVVITGCAHPGIVSIVERAIDLASPGDVNGGEVSLVMGGFHLGGASQSAIEGIVRDLRRLEVQRVAPCHCTGDLARSIFSQAYAEDFIPGGVGTRLKVGG